MPTVLYIFYLTGTMYSPAYGVAMPPADCTRLSEDDLYCLEHGVLIK